MQARRDRIVSGDIIPTLFWLAGPIALSQLVNISYSIVDAIFLGKLGKAEFGAPTVTWPLIFLFFSVGMGYSHAGISLVSQLYGAKKFKEAEEVAGKLLMIMLLLSLLLAGVPFYLSPLLLRLIGVPPDVLPHAIIYIRVVLLGLPFALLYFTFVIISNSTGDTRTPMRLSVAGSLINMILDPLLIFGLAGFPRLEVMGAALSTTVSRILISLIALYILVAGRGPIRVKPKLGNLMRDKFVKSVLKIGSMLAVQRSSNSLGFVIMISIVSHFGSTAVAAYGVAIRIIDLFQAFNMSLSRATEIMVGQNIGASNFQRARTIVKKSMMIITVIMSLGGLLIYIVAPHFVRVFVNDPEVITEGSRLLRMLVPSLPFFGLFFIASATATGSGKVKIFTLISLARLWVFRLGTAVVAAFYLGLGVDGIWLSIPLSNIIAGTIALAWVFKTEWYKGIIGREITGKDTVETPEK